MRCDDAVEELARTQHGVVASWQLAALGLRSTEVSRFRRRRGWELRSRRVSVRTGSPDTVEQRLTVAVLDASPGAAVAGPSAAWMWGAPGFRAEPIHLVRPKGLSRRSSPFGTVHEVVDLHPAQLKVVSGITVVSPARVVCELCASHPHRAERVLDRFWSERLLDGRTFHRTVGQLRDRGRAGSTFMRELDDARGPGYVPPASNLERRFMDSTDELFERQVDLGDEEWCGRVDFRHLHHPLVVEVQSERYHSALVDRVADAARKARLEAAGFAVVEVWDTEVWHRPAEVNARIAAELRPLKARAA